MIRSLAAALLLGILALGCHDPATVSQAPPGFLFSDASAGPLHACAVDLQGTVYCWGTNTHGELGSQTGTDGFRPVAVPAKVVFRAVSAGFSHSCALDTDAAVWCWGWGINGQLGFGGFGDSERPMPVAGFHRFSSISSGWDHSCGIAEAGTAYCWGRNADGQLGDGTTDNRAGPVVVAGGLHFTRISAGAAHTCAIDTEQHAWCWGANTLGQLGRGLGGGSSVPVAVAGGLAFTDVSAGFSHTCGVSAQRAYCWGSDAHGELGDLGFQREGVPGSTQPKAVASQVIGDPTMAGVSAGFETTCAWGVTGAGYCWGRGVDGQLGTGVLRDTGAPGAIEAVDGNGPDRLAFTRLSARGLRYACGLTNTNAVYCWGAGESGQLGSPVMTSSVVPVRVSAP